MHLRQILAAADDSAEGRAAILAAARLARASGGLVTVLTVTETDGSEPAGPRRQEGLRRLTQSVLAEMADAPPVDHAIVAGLPGIEICRFAEERRVDLILLGRKRRTERQRLLIGDTADAVARRSALPCLFVPAGQGSLTRVIAALDGTERGFAVWLAAVEFTREIGGRLRAVTVEPAYENEVGVTRVPTGRSARLAQVIGELRGSLDSPEGPRGRPSVDTGEALMIRRGAVVEEITREIDDSGADVLVVGYHRGGPAGIIETGCVSRRLTHESPCAVLTIPL
jgi:nucleotide-binding universal stress UspA family protein